MSTTNLKRNRELAMRAKLSMGHPQAMRMMQRWLLDWGNSDQFLADEAVALVEACSKLLGMDIDGAVDWDALTHCVANSLHNDFTESGSYRLEFMQLQSGFWDNQPESTEFAAIMQSIFGNRFEGNPYIANHCDVHGRGAAIVIKQSPY